MSTIYNGFMDLPESVRAKILDDIDAVSDSDAKKAHDEMLNECCEMVRIGSLEYEPAYALERIDPVAYRCSVADYLGDEDNGFIELNGQYYRTADVENAVVAAEAEASE